jgi:transcriptional regulator with XRE-family HTH domain
MSFYEKYLMLCDKNKKTPSGAALEMGLSKTTVNRWKNGGGITDATILKVATFFGVSKEELKGDPEQKEKPAPGGSELDARFDALLSQMTDADRADLLEYMEFKVAKRKENPNG